MAFATLKLKSRSPVLIVGRQLKAGLGHLKATPHAAPRVVFVRVLAARVHLSEVEGRALLPPAAALRGLKEVLREDEVLLQGNELHSCMTRPVDIYSYILSKGQDLF